MHNEEYLIPIVAIGGGCMIAIVAIVFGVMKNIVTRRSVEATRREIAAYVAEGSMTADEGERLLNAGASVDDE